MRVLDLSRILAGPWATQILADLGAEVLKIERPHVGDDTRHWGPPYVEAPDGSAREAAYFCAANRGKRSLAIDIAKPEGADLVRALAARSQIVVENFKVGDLARYGLDRDTLTATNPALVYCSITGFGQDGPYASRPGYDSVAQAMGGLMSVTGEADGPPLKSGVAVADLMTGLYASNAILAALRHAERTGEGQTIDMALLDVQVAAMANLAMNFLATGRPPTRMGNAHPTIVPYQTLPVTGGVITIAVANDRQFDRFCEVIGRPDLAADPRYAKNSDRIAHRAALIPQIAAATREFDGGDLLERLNAAGVPCGPVNTLADTFADPHVVHRGARVELHRDDLGAVPGVASPMRLSRTPVRYDRAPPGLGEGTREVLAAVLGLDEGALDGLETRGVI